jgi:Raf kinase inhibitor-like YbhB/YbcL family protein
MKKMIAAIAALACVAAACEKKDDGNGGDTSSPDVESTVPENGATVSVSAVLSATFSEALDPLSVTANTFRLSSGGTLVAGVVSYAGETATFTPTSALAGAASYTAQLTEEITDEAGNPLDSAYSWSFTTSSGEFALSSTGVTPGTQIPTQFTCDGLNVSPPLAWTAGPVGTLSYAIVFTDTSNDLIHWVIWDIAPATTLLPQDIPQTAIPNPPGDGALQVESYDNATFGYLGPCPPNEHVYQWVVYAIDVATLPNVTTASTRTQVETEILLHDLASASLTAPYDPP